MKRLYILFSLALLISLTNTTFAQLASAPVRGTITGKVSTSDGKPAAYVNVQIVENNKKTLTKEDGTFIFSHLKSGKYTVKTSYIGLEVQTQTATVIEGQDTKLYFTLDESSSELNEVIIAANVSPNLKPVSLGKISIPVRDLPQAVQIINSQTITDQQASRLSDVLKNVNGVAFGANRGGVSGETFYARGYALGANNVFKNGARTTTGGMPETSTLESVEVLKGSAALLYGGVSGGAVVNMVTKKPQFNYGGEVSMRAGSYDLYKPTADIYGPITKDLAFRVIGTYEDAGSYRDHVTSNRVYVNPSLLYKVSDKTEILLQGDYLKSDFTPDFGVGTVGNQLPANISRHMFLNTSWAYNKTNTTTAQANITHKFNDSWKLNVVASLQSYTRNYFSSERPAALADGSWNRALTRSKTDEGTYNQQINLSGNFKTAGIAHTLLVGADADQSITKAYGFSDPNLLKDAKGAKYYDAVNILDPNSFNIPSNFNMPETSAISDTKTPIYRIGGFVQDLIALTDQFKVLAGLRYTYQRTPRSKAFTYDTGVQTLVANGIEKTKTESAFSPKLGFIYEPFKTTSFYVSYANNFTSNAGLDVNTNAPMDPSIIDQYEAGIKNDFLGGRLTANLTVYRINNSKFAQTAEFRPDGAVNGDTNLKEFTGKTASDGVELDITGTIVEGLNFLAGYSYNYMRYTHTREESKTPDNKVVTGGIVEGERLVGTTKNTANGSLFYTIQNGGLKGLKLGASAYYTGDRNGGRNTNKSGTSTGIIPLKAFTTFDLSAGYQWKKLSLLTKIANITNELNYFVHENYSVNPIPPRQFLATLSYKF
ncbi:TonB-dependent receptor [Pedobacter sp. N36a]|uniref:TonB-dependent receptor n=1 Tax=Pedobacter sp. N36a TaxID=2767996 RepID=UPI00165731F1|nr:TonB-dependent receptor [Pedobacter sp. N36a]MBC8987590.1 TonB-dependent receptor [Pedobacter sp. N36a]